MFSFKLFHSFYLVMIRVACDGPDDKIFSLV